MVKEALNQPPSSVALLKAALSEGGEAKTVKVEGR
jgi:hypothetical protein